MAPPSIAPEERYQNDQHFIHEVLVRNAQSILTHSEKLVESKDTADKNQIKLLLQRIYFTYINDLFLFLIEEIY